MSNNSAIAISKLNRRYGDHYALSSVSFALPVGATLGVFGANGAGKSTLLRILATLIRPDTGSNVSVLGQALPANAESIRAQCGYVGHQSLLYRELSPRENLTFFAQLYRLNGVQQRVNELIETMGLISKATAPLRTLSQGITQRVAICRAVLHQPKLLLLDEPYANLDPVGRTLASKLLGVRTEQTRVIVSHDPNTMLPACDYVLGLEQGQVKFFADRKAGFDKLVAELFTDESDCKITCY